MTARAYAAPPHPYLSIRDMVFELMRTGQHQAALTSLQRAHAQLGYEPRLVADMATCFWKMGDEATAIRLMVALTEDAAATAEDFARLGGMYLSTGAVGEAGAALEQALRLRPDSVNALVALNQVKPIAADSKRARAIRGWLNAGKLTRPEKSSLYGLLGKIEENSGNFARAMTCYGRGRALIGGTYDPEQAEAELGAQIAHYHPAPDDGGGASGPRMVFIVGMPRSGTTLAESIFLRHPDVATLGETHALAECLAQWNLSHKADEKWQAIRSIDGAMAGRLRALYLSVAGRAQGGASPQVLIDKTPLNALHLGFARAIFPDCRFIHMSRHPLDLGVSNFGTSFSETFIQANPFLKSLAHIGHFSRIVHDSVQDYQAKLGGTIRVQSYRALVENLESEARALIAHAGLEWHDACLHPESREGNVRTASTLQVRVPVHTGRVGRWRTFGDSIQPLIDGFGGWERIAEWERQDDHQGKSGSPTASDQ